MRSWKPSALVAAAIAAMIAGCQAKAPEPEASTSAPPAAPAAEHPADQSLSLVIARHATELMGIPGVVGVYEGETEGRPVLRESPVVRPDFLTAWPTDAPTVLALIVPTSRIEPSVRTWPEITDAMAQSTFELGRLLMPDRLATFWAFAAVQLTSIRPGWTTGSPGCATRPLPPLTMSASST